MMLKISHPILMCLLVTYGLFADIVSDTLSINSMTTEETGKEILRKHSISCEDLWDGYALLLTKFYQAQQLSCEESDAFKDLGYTIGVLQDNNEVEELCHSFEGAHKIQLMVEDFDLNYDFGHFNFHTANMLNEQHDYFMLEDTQLNAVEKLLKNIEPHITESVGMPWRVINVRYSSTRPHNPTSGPNTHHTDGLPPSVYKIMVYINGVGKNSGTTELTVNGKPFQIEGPPGTWLLFKNSEVIHRGIPPKQGKRPCIEITIAKSSCLDTKPFVAGLNARFPILPWGVPRSWDKTPKSKHIIGINVGGGPNWSAPNWINLEEVLSPKNPSPYYLHPNCRFPALDNSIETVFTSHCLEHLILPTALRVVSEAYRVLKDGADLIIKIPDYDKTIQAWRNRDRSFFWDNWGIESVSSNWGLFGVCDCLDHRAAMIFCSFCNKGSPFGKAESKVETANSSVPGYFGPPRMSQQELLNIIHPMYDRSPSTLSREMRNIALSLENSSCQFVHQTAWGQREMREMLESFGFEIISFNPAEIEAHFSNILGIDEMRPISLYCWAKKRS